MIHLKVCTLKKCLVPPKSNPWGYMYPQINLLVGMLIHKKSTKWCYNMFFQAKYLIFVSSLKFCSIFKKWDNFLEISLLNEKPFLFISIYGLFCKYDIFLYRIVMLRGFSLQRTLVPFVVKINKFEANEFLPFALNVTFHLYCQ